MPTLEQRFAALEAENRQLRAQITELSKKTTRFRDMILSTPVAVAVASVETELVDYGNPAFASLLGYDLEELMGLPLTKVFAEEPDYIQHLFVKCVAEGAWQGELRYCHKDGSPIPALLTASVLHDSDGKPYAVVGFAHDLREQKEQEGQLRIFKLLVDNAPDGIALSNTDLRITYANPAFVTMMGHHDSLIGQPVSSLIIDEDHALLETLAKKVLVSGTVIEQLHYQRPNGDIFTAQVSGLIIYDEQGRPIGFASINRDLTDQLRAEQERRTLQEEVIQAQQAALRELSTPLMPIADKVVVMPIIGSIDQTRAQMIMETLLEGIAAHRATFAILDITGVRVVDTQVAAAMIRAAQAARMLGAEVVLTGIGPEVAQTLVHIGADLRELVARSSLQQGIAYAMKRI
ncbi:PAS domain S-box protein [Candidatus Chloroploca sp. M-50]|uniref:PAS domain S-box protein n=1 Tax=Candidatus Chloroploca mongolica TaxID=2528176 RepID=A0ABS4D3U6_9CHLR|nr:PAS domain S-box protein [Candidatus Chloroploca mongolica]MBP1464105.1 PAS domain S-box protein [Candidatus Chloroploca mongolica]